MCAQRPARHRQGRRIAGHHHRHSRRLAEGRTHDREKREFEHNAAITRIHAVNQVELFTAAGIYREKPA